MSNHHPDHPHPQPVEYQFDDLAAGYVQLILVFHVDQHLDLLLLNLIIFKKIK